MTAQLREEPDVIRSVKNTSGGTLLKGTIVKLKLTPVVPNEVISSTAATESHYGVLMADVLDGAYGDCMLRGLGQVRGGAAVAVGDKVTADADGEGVPTTAAGQTMIGLALTVGADNALFECEINCSGGQAGA